MRIGHFSATAGHQLRICVYFKLQLRDVEVWSSELGKYHDVLFFFSNDPLSVKNRADAGFIDFKAWGLVR